MMEITFYWTLMFIFTLFRQGWAAGQPAVGLCMSAVINHGYECHEIEMTTADGFILGLQRIPHGRAGVSAGNRPPVFLQHGVLVDGMAWLVNSPEQNLPMILADNGFDVWIGNTRGTRFSRRHTSLDSWDPRFWNWSWDELATLELPAVLHYVSRKTSQPVHYVGHSMGTLIALASLSQGLLAGTVKSAALLSPIAHLSRVTTPIAQIAARAFLGEIIELIGVAEFNPLGEPAHSLMRLICSHGEVNCYDLLSSFTGPNCCLNSSTMNAFLDNEPQSTSTKNMVHFAQMVRDGKVAKYDYGSAVHNLMYYGADVPPSYDLASIPRELPMFIGYGGEDALSDVEDVKLLLRELRFHEKGKLSLRYVGQYAHADFVLGSDANDLVYSHIVSFFKRQN